MTELTLTKVNLKSCPFCAGAARIERKGSRDATMIVSCTGCGCRVESGDVCRPDKTRGLRLEPTRAFAYNAAFESLAEQHMDELEADAKANPVIAQGMTAGVFDEDKLLELMQEA